MPMPQRRRLMIGGLIAFVILIVALDSVPAMQETMRHFRADWDEQKLVAAPTTTASPAGQ